MTALAWMMTRSPRRTRSPMRAPEWIRQSRPIVTPSPTVALGEDDRARRRLSLPAPDAASGPMLAPSRDRRVGGDDRASDECPRPWPDPDRTAASGSPAPCARGRRRRSSPGRPAAASPASRPRRRPWWRRAQRPHRRSSASARSPRPFRVRGMDEPCDVERAVAGHFGPQAPSLCRSSFMADPVRLNNAGT